MRGKSSGRGRDASGPGPRSHRYRVTRGVNVEHSEQTYQPQRQERFRPLIEVLSFHTAKPPEQVWHSPKMFRNHFT
jgi:hypothetical protein